MWALYAGNALLACALWSHATPASAFFSAIWSYVKQYQLGIDYSSSYDGVTASYETSMNGGVSHKNCAAVPADPEPTSQRCSVRMTGAASSGLGLFLQQAFKRQGTFYFAADLGFGARYLQGELDEAQVAEQKSAGLPLESMSFTLLALVIKPYITIGITPASRWPDILLSLGPAAQIAAGKVAVNGEESAVAVATANKSLVSGFFELELVFWRFGKGAFSLYTSSDFSGGGEGTKFYPRAKDDMRDIRADFSRNVSGGFFGLGAKLVLNWP